MHKPLAPAGDTRGLVSGASAFVPVAFGGSSRLTFRRLRRPTPLPTLASLNGFTGYLGRLTWLFGSR